ncbi:hypothetical protein A4S05_14300 [Nostoc sp. KVJ20]|uniref:eCIS core domain-containing protein n=1 Tax=Nostoc sp. KVJ20 TaxID=457944 RepID=UPI00083DB58C|nr:DUF4157 domain-containing protein [Nostoc sp. KVJ20]ODG97271.1 hypothetical protein A4S05_14300 [Nostoc sp. KVJ20]
MSNVQRQAALRPGNLGREKADTSTFLNPSLASPSIPTLANPIRGFGLQRVTEASPDLQKAHSVDGQLVEPEAIKQSPLSHDISRMSLRPQKALNKGVVNRSENAVIQGSGIKNASYGVDVVSPSGGQNLPEPVLAKMQTAFSTDLSDVKVHTDGQAEKLGSQAFASGNNLHFAQGKYDPESQSGQALIGHELTHVVQQRQGRVNIPQLSGEGNSIVVQDQALEAEADMLGNQAAASSEVDSKQSIQAQKIDGTVSNAVQQKPIVQNALPVIGAITAWGGTLATESAAAAATVTAATIQGLQAAAQVGGALAPGQSGVQSVQLDNGYMSPVDRQKLQLITQYRLINAYVSHWKRQHPDVPLAPPTQGTAPTPAPTPATPTPTPATPAPTPATPAPAAPDSPNQSGGTLDLAILEAVKAEVQLQVETLLNTNQKTLTNVEYIWSDSGDHTADSIGTVGAVEFSNLRGTFIKETLQLSSDAAQIPNLDPPSRGQEMDVRQFRGGSMRRGSSMSIGYGDSLSINLTGSGPTIDHAGNNGHGEHTYSTDWNWDGNTTQGDFPLYIQPDGKPTFASPKWRGEPDDNSYF